MSNLYSDAKLNLKSKSNDSLLVDAQRSELNMLSMDELDDVNGGMLMLPILFFAGYGAMSAYMDYKEGRFGGRGR